MELRDRRPADLAALAGVLQGVHDEDDYPTVWPPDAAGWLASAGGLGAWVATVDGDVAGHVSLDRPETGARTEVWMAATSRPSSDLAEVTRLFISRHHRGRGIGQHLLARAVDTAHRGGLWPVLDVRHDGRVGASGLYAAAGWRLVGTAERRLSAEMALSFDCWVGPRPSGLPDR